MKKAYLYECGQQGCRNEYIVFDYPLSCPYCDKGAVNDNPKEEIFINIIKKDDSNG